MKAFFVAILLSSSVFSTTSNEVIGTRSTATRYCYHYSIYNGKWHGSRTVPEKVFFISEVENYDCEMVPECEKVKTQIKNAFVRDLSSNGVNGSSITPEYFDEIQKARSSRAGVIRLYKGYGYRIVEL